MPSDETSTLNLVNEAAELSKALRLEDSGLLVLPEAEQSAWVPRLTALPADRKEVVGTHIAALAYRLAEMGGAPTRPAVEVLLGLAALILPPKAHAEVLPLAEDPVVASSLLGLESDRRPAPSGGGLSLFDFRLGVGESS